MFTFVGLFPFSARADSPPLSNCHHLLYCCLFFFLLLLFFRKCETNSVAHRKGATLCPASREHCVQPPPPPVICSSSLLPSLPHQWLTCSLPSHWFLPPGYKIMNRPVLLFISVGGGYNKGFRLCSKVSFFKHCFSIKVFLLKHPEFCVYPSSEILIFTNKLHSYASQVWTSRSCFLIQSFNTCKHVHADA